MYRQRRSISDVLPVKIAIQHFVRHVYLSKSWATKYIDVWNTIAEITRAYTQPYHHQAKRVVMPKYAVKTAKYKGNP